MQLVFTLLVVAATLVFLIRGVDVRLVLFTAGLVLAAAGGHPLAIFDVFLRELGNGATIGPICTAMGYGYVLRLTGCDKVMVALLLAPVQRARWLLIPGGCVVGFVTNAAITSQTAVAAAVGPILVPLMTAAGYSPLLAAATLVLGCSGGGSLYNPGDADLVAIQAASGAPMRTALGAMGWPLASAFAAAVIVFILLARRGPDATAGTNPAAAEYLAGAPKERWKALLPPLPVLMIFVFLPGVLPPLPGPFFGWLQKTFEKGLPVSHAMLLATVIVLVACRSEASKTVKSFFEGMGYAFAQIISLIVTAACFIEGLGQMGLIDQLVRLVSGTGLASKLAAAFFPGSLAIVCGSGIGPSVAFSKAVLPTLAKANQAGALDLGVVGAIAANFGRTMSPVAAVVIFCATFVGVPTIGIVRRTAVPLLVGVGVAIAVVMARS